MSLDVSEGIFGAGFRTVQKGYFNWLLRSAFIVVCNQITFKKGLITLYHSEVKWMWSKPCHENKQSMNHSFVYTLLEYVSSVYIFLEYCCMTYVLSSITTEVLTLFWLRRLWKSSLALRCTSNKDLIKKRIIIKMLLKQQTEMCMIYSNVVCRLHIFTS